MDDLILSKLSKGLHMTHWFVLFLKIFKIKNWRKTTDLDYFQPKIHLLVTILY